MNRLSYSFIVRLSAFLMLLIVGVACTKTKYETHKRPYNAIEHFSIVGYGSLDSINAVIFGDTIKIYWSAEATLPERISPTIIISPGAVVSPSSGESVAFSENTVYTVTAEDGTTKKYILKPIVNDAIPILAAFDDVVAWQWATVHQLKINGEYFANTGESGRIQAYAKRLRDGYEFDLAIDNEKTIQTQLVVDLPKFTADQDTGLHRIYLKVGDFPSNSLDVYIGQPVLTNIATSLTLKEAGQPVYLNDTLILTINLGPKIDLDQFKKYFSKNNIGVDNSVQFNFGYHDKPSETHYGAMHYDSSQVILQDNHLKVPFILGDRNPTYALPNFKGGAYINEILVRFDYDYSFYGSSYKEVTDFMYLPVGPLTPSFYEFIKYADDDTRKMTILKER